MVSVVEGRVQADIVHAVQDGEHGHIGETKPGFNSACDFHGRRGAGELLSAAYGEWASITGQV
jgi:hypothetical protein